MVGTVEPTVNLSTQATIAVATYVTSTNLPITYSATGLPAGYSIDTSTGVISGTPQGAAEGTIVVTATDSTSAAETISFPYTIAAIVDPVLSKIQALETIFINAIKITPATVATQTQAAQAYLGIIKTIIANPQTTYLTELTNFMTMYVSSYFTETVFVPGTMYLTASDRTLVMAVYTAWRSITQTPSKAFDTSTIASLTGGAPLAIYVQSIIATGAAPVAPTQPTPSGAGNYQTPSLVMGANGATTVSIGGVDYSVTLSGDTTMAFVTSQTLLFPTGTFFAESEIVVTLNSHILSLDAAVKLSVDAQAKVQTLTGTAYVPAAVNPISKAGYSYVLLKLETLDSGASWIVTDIDAS